MKKKLSFGAIALALVSFSCNSKKLAQDEKLETLPVADTKCYTYISNNDTVRFSVTSLNNEFEGKLTYNLFEKDGNRGTVTGMVKGDTLLGEYVFMSEGVTSRREVAFLKKGNNLVEGFAPLDDTGTHFKNRAELDFTGLELAGGDCGN